MSRKRVRWLVAVLLVIGIALVSFWWFVLRPPYGITQRSFSKIQDGMTLDEVKAIIGVPPTEISKKLMPTPKGEITYFFAHWIGPEASMILYLDENQIVIEKRCRVESTGFLLGLLEMLGL